LSAGTKLVVVNWIYLAIAIMIFYLLVFHWIGVRSKMRMLGLNQPKFVPPLNSAMAIETGSNILGELTIFTIGISLILMEFAR